MLLFFSFPPFSHQPNTTFRTELLVMKSDNKPKEQNNHVITSPDLLITILNNKMQAKWIAEEIRVT